MTRPAIATSERRRAGLGETLGAALGALFPLVLLGAILGIGVIIGTSLLIVPGMLIYVFWAVAPAAAANERDGVFLALSRSQELSEGARWKVLGIVLILLALSIAVAILMSFLVFLSRGAGWGGSFLIIDLVIRGIFGAIMNVVYGAVQASLYVELAEWKEGGSVEALAQVFV